MGYFGVQSRRSGEVEEAAFVALIDAPDGSSHRDIVQFVDGDGYDTAIAITYWCEAVKALVPELGLRSVPQGSRGCELIEARAFG